MIVKFHARGAGGGSGPVDYLLGKDRQREGATLDRGDPEAIKAIIDASPYAKKYTSGVLSFSEPDLKRAVKNEMMSSFEKMMFPGLDADQYSCLWVEHRDKDRLELNFVIPNIELHSGKRLQPWYKKRDFSRVNNWKNIANYDYKLTDPNDPENRRALTRPSDLPANRADVARTITDSLLVYASQDQLRNRQSVINVLTDAGFSISRETKKSISIADPDGGRNIRLEGSIYERDFQFSENTREEISKTIERYRRAARERTTQARKELQAGVKRLEADNQQRYPRNDAGITTDSRKYTNSERQDEVNSSQVMGLDTLNPNNSSQCDTGLSLVSGKADIPESSRDRGSTSDLETVETGNLRNSFGGEQKREIYSDPQKMDSQYRLDGGRETRDQIIGELNDGIRNAITELCHRVSSTARKTTLRISKHLRSLTADVRSYFEGESSLKAASRGLRSASEGLNEVINKTQMILKEQKEDRIKINIIQQHNRISKEYPTENNDQYSLSHLVQRLKPQEIVNDQIASKTESISDDSNFKKDGNSATSTKQENGEIVEEKSDKDAPTMTR